MLYVSQRLGNNLYEITDTSTFVKSKVDISQLRQYVADKQEIHGVRTSMGQITGVVPVCRFNDRITPEIVWKTTNNFDGFFAFDKKIKGSFTYKKTPVTDKQKGKLYLLSENNKFTIYPAAVLSCVDVGRKIYKVMYYDDSTHKSAVGDFCLKLNYVDNGCLVPSLTAPKYGVDSTCLECLLTNKHFADSLEKIYQSLKERFPNAPSYTLKEYVDKYGSVKYTDEAVRKKAMTNAFYLTDVDFIVFEDAQYTLSMLEMLLTYRTDSALCEPTQRVQGVVSLLKALADDDWRISIENTQSYSVCINLIPEQKDLLLKYFDCNKSKLCTVSLNNLIKEMRADGGRSTLIADVFLNDDLLTFNLIEGTVVLKATDYEFFYGFSKSLTEAKQLKAKFFAQPSDFVLTDNDILESVKTNSDVLQIPNGTKVVSKGAFEGIEPKSITRLIVPSSVERWYKNDTVVLAKKFNAVVEIHTNSWTVIKAIVSDCIENDTFTTYGFAVIESASEEIFIKVVSALIIGNKLRTNHSCHPIQVSNKYNTKRYYPVYKGNLNSKSHLLAHLSVELEDDEFMYIPKHTLLEVANDFDKWFTPAVGEKIIDFVIQQGLDNFSFINAKPNVRNEANAQSKCYYAVSKMRFGYDTDRGFLSDVQSRDDLWNTVSRIDTNMYYQLSALGYGTKPLIYQNLVRFWTWVAYYYKDLKEMSKIDNAFCDVDKKLFDLYMSFADCNFEVSKWLQKHKG